MPITVTRRTNSGRLDRSLHSLVAKVLPFSKLQALIAKVNALEAHVAAISPANGANAFLLSAPVLAIKAGSSPTVKSSGAFSAYIAGTVVSKAANTDMSALAGTLATAKAALWVFYMDSAGTISTSTKTADAANAAAALALKPAAVANKIELGYVIVANATGSNFVGGTTALDTADLTVTYVPATVGVAALAATEAEGLD